MTKVPLIVALVKRPDTEETEEDVCVVCDRTTANALVGRLLQYVRDIKKDQALVNDCCEFMQTLVKRNPKPSDEVLAANKFAEQEWLDVLDTDAAKYLGLRHGINAADQAVFEALCVAIGTSVILSDIIALDVGITMIPFWEPTS